MKRVLFFLTAVFLLAAFAGGCGGEKKAEKPAAKPAAAETKKAEKHENWCFSVVGLLPIFE